MKYLVIILLLVACDKPSLYRCESPMMNEIYFEGYSETEIEAVIKWRAEWLKDTMICECLNK